MTGHARLARDLHRGGPVRPAAIPARPWLGPPQRPAGDRGGGWGAGGAHAGAEGVRVAARPLGTAQRPSGPPRSRPSRPRSASPSWRGRPKNSCSFDSPARRGCTATTRSPAIAGRACRPGAVRPTGRWQYRAPGSPIRPAVAGAGRAVSSVRRPADRHRVDRRAPPRPGGTPDPGVGTIRAGWTERHMGQRLNAPASGHIGRPSPRPACLNTPHRPSDCSDRPGLRHIGAYRLNRI